jgi:hypothetical protein
MSSSMDPRDKEMKNITIEDMEPVVFKALIYMDSLPTRVILMETRKKM